VNATWQNLLEVLDEAVKQMPSLDSTALYNAAIEVERDHPGLLETRDPAALMLKVILRRDWV
jgi:hypothetical protein